VTPDKQQTIYIFGEGRTDVGTATEPAGPNTGVVPILTHKLCGKPDGMAVVRRATPYLQGKGLWQKVRFAKRQASAGAGVGAVFVVDSEGDNKALSQKTKELEKGRDATLPDLVVPGASRRLPTRSSSGFDRCLVVTPARKYHDDSSGGQMHGRECST